MVKIVKTLTEEYDEKKLQRILEHITDCYEAAKKILEPEPDDSTTIEKVLDRTKERLIAGETVYLRDFMEETGFYISAWNRSPWVNRCWKLEITQTQTEEVIGP